jgi:hypothetical protein
MNFYLRSLVIIGVILGTMGITVLYASYEGRRMIESACLARTLDVSLDKFAMSKGSKWLSVFRRDDNDEVFRQQAFMAALVHVRRVRQGKEYFCPPDNAMGKLEMARNWLLSSSKFWSQSARTTIITQAAREAYAGGDGGIAWSDEYACVDIYKATRLRLPPSEGRYVGHIANMSLYCSQ